MKQTLLRLLSCCSILLCAVPGTHAQTWQWTLRGGGNEDDDTGPTAREEVTRMATDRNGNVYVLSYVVGPGNVEGRPVVQDSKYTSLVLSSFRCDGSFRWAKSFDINVISGLATDSLDGVYLSGVNQNGVFRMGDISGTGADTSWTFAPGNKNMMLIKLDTSGKRQWMRFPQPDTTTATSFLNFRPVDMDVEPNGNVHWLCRLAAGAYAGGALVVSTTGNYILRYDAAGNYSGNALLQLNSADPDPYSIDYANMYLKCNTSGNGYIIAGVQDPGDGTILKAGTTTLSGNTFVIRYDNLGALRWARHGEGGIVARPAIDARDNIYLVGCAKGGSTLFNGYMVNNEYSSLAYYTPLVLKLDAAGNAVWTRASSATISSVASGITISDSAAVVTGSYGSPFKWNGAPDSLLQPVGVGTNPLVSRFRALDGKYLRTDTIASVYGSFDYGNTIAADRFGNVYVGGRFGDSLLITGRTIKSAGGSNDFFLAKYGSTNCTKIEKPSSLTENNIAAATLDCYPNPVTEQLTLVNRGGQDLRLWFCDITGRVIWQQVLTAGTTLRYETTLLPAGLYLLKASAEDGSLQCRKISKY